MKNCIQLESNPGPLGGHTIWTKMANLRVAKSIRRRNGQKLKLFKHYQAFLAKNVIVKKLVGSDLRGKNLMIDIKVN